VADALGHAHGLGVIHREIKPEDILLQGGHALVADDGARPGYCHAMVPVVRLAAMTPYAKGLALVLAPSSAVRAQPEGHGRIAAVAGKSEARMEFSLLRLEFRHAELPEQEAH
jgi:serine/threonine protein kinase